jgi:CHAT domain-containing protein/tetratricopeptide (TPR) repeat protein
LKRILLILVLQVLHSLEVSLAQVSRIDQLTDSFSRSYNSSDFISAEKTLMQLLDPQLKVPPAFLPYIYCNLGVTNTALGRYGDAINFYNKGEAATRTHSDSVNYLSEIYINKGLILEYNRSFREAIDYLEKGIRLNEKYSDIKDQAFFNISVGYQNLGILYYEMNDYDKALEFSMKSYSLKTKNKLEGLPLVIFNIAKCNAKKSNFAKAEEYFQKSIGLMISENGPEFYRLPEIYFEYSRLLYTLNRKDESLRLLKKSLEIYLNKYGEKYTLTSYSYRLLGDYYRNQAVYDSALIFYQKSLMTIVPGFNNPDISINPSCDTSLYDIRLLENLKAKALALKLLATEQKDRDAKISTLSNSLETISLVSIVLGRIRENLTEENSMITLADDEKETWISAVGIAGSLYDLTGSPELLERMYSFAQKAKASVLQNEISENDILNSPSVPDSLRRKLSMLTANIDGLNRLIAEESQITKPDQRKLTLLKDEVFSLKKDIGKVRSEVYAIFPESQNLLAKTEPLSLQKIREQLAKGQTILDYSLSNNSAGGKRKLFIFVISSHGTSFVATEVDSAFSRDAAIIQAANTPAMASDYMPARKQSHNEALFRMNQVLFEPVKKLVMGKRIIIIPDEELAFLPFEAFLSKMPTGSEEIHYLLNDYAISYAYSSSLIFSRSGKFTKVEEVFAFSPDYGSGFSGGSAQKLYGADEEIASLYKWFGGEGYIGPRATETNFRRMIVKPAIFHLAMHSIPDTLNSRFSFLLFDSHSDTAGDGRLYNYEISLLRIKSPMVVLSACNSGTGTLYHGEGLMSLARGFILAGASSVIRTSWEVNDQTSSEIIGSFYKYLSRGMAKDEAMRRARLDYIKSSPPAYAGPYYWAAYEVLGDPSPVTGRKDILLALIIAVVAGVDAGLLYFRRRRMVSDHLPK